MTFVVLLWLYLDTIIMDYTIVHPLFIYLVKSVVSIEIMPHVGVVHLNITGLETYQGII